MFLCFVQNLEPVFFNSHFFSCCHLRTIVYRLISHADVGHSRGATGKFVGSDTDNVRCYKLTARPPQQTPSSEL